jgi:hypothetical protein
MAGFGSNSSRFDPLPPDKSDVPFQDGHGVMGGASQATGVEGGQEIETRPSDAVFLGMLAHMETISRDYQSKTVERQLTRAYKAYQNQHDAGSKYLGTAYKGRSRLFVPKTLSAVRKNLAAAAASLFSTEDVVQISAAYEDDPMQRAAAATVKGAIDYRLTAATDKYGVPWFLTAMGGCLDGQLTGLTISKQFWEYIEVPTKELEIQQQPLIDEETGEPVMDLVLNPLDGQPLLDDITGEPMLQPVMQDVEVPKMQVKRDRPVVELHPIENVGLDPAAPWMSPVQGGRWFYMRHAIGISDLRAMMKSAAKGGGLNLWLANVPDEVLLKGRIEDDRTGSRRVREGGGDRYEDAKGTGDLDIVWIQENFIRIDGVDWQFWSVGRHGIISQIVETHEAYPALDGMRPYVCGVSRLQSHTLYPMSPVESWQPLQLELNDITNLRQDALKRSIAPLPTVRRGAKVDIPALQRRGQPDAVIITDDPQKDIVFTSTPGPSGASYTETSVNNAMFDELAGVFSTSSVQSNRQLNETVGGMNLMSNAAGAVSEFDLRMWVETWVEPTLRQIVHLEQAYESDANVLAIAGSKAKVWQKFKTYPDLDAFAAVEVMLRVSVGIGSLDPMQKLQKFKFAMELLTPLWAEFAKQGIRIKGEEIIEEVFGAAGFKDGRRFFEFGEPQDAGPPPEIIKLQADMQAKHEALMADLEKTMATLRSKEMIAAQSDQTKLLIAEKNEKNELVKASLSLTQAHQGQEHERLMGAEVRDHQAAMGRDKMAHDARSQQQAAAAKAAGGGMPPAAGASVPGGAAPTQTREQRIRDMIAVGAGATPRQPRPSFAPPGGDAAPPVTPLVPQTQGQGVPQGGSMGEDDGSLLADQGMGSTPPGGPPPAMGGGGDVSVALGQIMAKIDGLVGRIEQTDRTMAQIVAHLTAPTEILRDPRTGKPIAIRKGGQTQLIERDASGNIEGVKQLASQ